MEQTQKSPPGLKDLASDHLGHLSSVRVGGLLVLLMGCVMLWFSGLHEQAKTAFTVATTLLLTGQARAALEGVASSLSTSWVEGKKAGVTNKESQPPPEEEKKAA